MPIGARLGVFAVRHHKLSEPQPERVEPDSPLIQEEVAVLANCAQTAVLVVHRSKTRPCMSRQSDMNFITYQSYFRIKGLFLEFSTVDL